MGSDSKKATVFCCTAFCFYWLFVFFLLITRVFYQGGTSVFENVWFWATVAHIATLGVLSLLSRQQSPLHKSTLVAFGSPIMAVAGYVIIRASEVAVQGSAGVMIFGALLVGVGTGGLLGCWCELYTGLFDASRKRFVLAVAVLVSTLLLSLLSFVPLAVLGVLLVLFPVLSMAATCIGMRSVHFADKPTKPSREQKRPGLGARSAFFCLMYSLPLGFFQTRFAFATGNSIPGWAATIGLAFVLMAAVVAVDLLVRRDREESIILKVVVPISIGGLMLFAVVGDGSAQAAGVLLYASQQLLTVLFYSQFAEYAHASRIAPIRIFAVGVGFVDGGFILGMVAGELSLVLFQSHYLELTLGIAYVVALAGFLVFSNRAGKSLFVDGDAPESTGEPAAPAPDDALRSRIDGVSEDFALTAREREMVSYIMRGKSVPAIASEAYLSPNTVKTHLSHVYQKLDVHSRDELVRFVEDYRSTNG